jgi:hypothetical protein
MKQKKLLHAYIDESGDPHFNEKASKNLIYSCILIDANDVNRVSDQLKEIRSKFGLSEFKSSKVDSESRRIEILSELVKLDFKHVYLWIDKEKITVEWKQYFRTFYKFTQKLLNRELYRSFGDLNITIDRYGSPEYQRSLKEYIDSDPQLNFLDNFEFGVGSAKDDVLLQLADFLGGTRRKLIENDFENSDVIKTLLQSKNIFSFKWPDNYYYLCLDDIKDDHDKEIAKICIDCAELYIKLNKDYIDSREKVLTVEYLLTSASYIKPNEYIYTDELLGWLSSNKIYLQEEEFRSRVIAGLRDEKVIIAGSRNGLKIPLNMEELVGHFNKSANMYISIIKRNKKAIDILKIKSMGKIDLLESELFRKHKKFFEIIESDYK